MGEAKVAVIAFQAAIGKTNEFQRDLADLQKKYEPRRDKLKTLSDEVDSLTKQLQDQGTQLSESERVSRARTLDEKKKELDRETQDAQSDFQSDLQQLISSMAEKVGTLMTDYADEAWIYAGAGRRRPAECHGALCGAIHRYHPNHY